MEQTAARVGSKVNETRFDRIFTSWSMFCWP